MYSRCICRLASTAAALRLRRMRAAGAGEIGGLLLGLLVGEGGVSWVSAEPSPSSVLVADAGAKGVRISPPPTAVNPVGRGPWLCGVTNSTPWPGHGQRLVMGAMHDAQGTEFASRSVWSWKFSIERNSSWTDWQVLCVCVECNYINAGPAKNVVAGDHHRLL